MGKSIERDGLGKRGLFVQDGRVWFTARAERRFYFLLTVLMLAAGILYKLGVF